MIAGDHPFFGQFRAAHPADHIPERSVLVVLLEMHLHLHRPRAGVVGERQSALPLARRVRPAQVLQDGPGIVVGKRSHRNLRQLRRLLRRRAVGRPGGTGAMRFPAWSDRRETRTCSPSSRAARRFRGATGHRDTCRRAASHRRRDRNRESRRPRRVPARQKPLPRESSARNAPARSCRARRSSTFPASRNPPGCRSWRKPLPPRRRRMATSR